MVWLLDGEKRLSIMIPRFDRIHERDRQTPHDGTGRAYAYHPAAKIYSTGHNKHTRPEIETVWSEFQVNLTVQRRRHRKTILEFLCPGLSP